MAKVVVKYCLLQEACYYIDYSKFNYYQKQHKLITPSSPLCTSSVIYSINLPLFYVHLNCNNKQQI